MKELPEAIKRNVEAYIGCLSGATMKDKYLEIMKEAVFHEVGIIAETQFLIEYVINDSAAKVVIDNSDISMEKGKEIADSVRHQSLRSNARRVTFLECAVFRTRLTYPSSIGGFFGESSLPVQLESQRVRPVQGCMLL